MTMLRACSGFASTLIVVLACSTSGGGRREVLDGGGQSSSASGSSNSNDEDASMAGSSGSNSGGNSNGNGGTGGDTLDDGGLDDGGNALGGNGGAGDDAGQPSSMDLFEQAVAGNPDPLTAAVRDQIAANFEVWELDYLMQIDWTVGDPLLDDPTFYRLLQALNSVAQFTDDPYTQALLICDDEPSVQRRRRVYMNCFGWPEMKLGLPPQVALELALAAGITHVGRTVADEEGSTVRESMNQFMSCNEPGARLDDTLWRLLNPCLKDTDCVALTGSEWGTHCGSETSLDLDYENTCDFAIAVHYCFNTPSGEWDCGIESNLPAGEIGGGGAWTCDTDGTYILEAMSQDDYINNCSFSNPNNPQ
ncbi:MAG TPA: hypothetical protein VHO25_13425 [Polyangiaceae bacterium]|nr:hypothetical protein [Polyangiaceae bacterium]